MDVVHSFNVSHAICNLKKKSVIKGYFSWLHTFLPSIKLHPLILAQFPLYKYTNYIIATKSLVLISVSGCAVSANCKPDCFLSDKLQTRNRRCKRAAQQPEHLIFTFSCYVIPL